MISSRSLSTKTIPKIRKTREFSVRAEVVCETKFFLQISDHNHHRPRHPENRLACHWNSAMFGNEVHSSVFLANLIRVSSVFSLPVKARNFPMACTKRTRKNLHACNSREGSPRYSSPLRSGPQPCVSREPSARALRRLQPRNQLVLDYCL